MTNLYFSPQPTRSSRARWGFLEAGLKFTGHTVDIFKGEQKADDFLALNPLGFVPAATFDGDAVTEYWTTRMAEIVAALRRTPTRQVGERCGR